MVENTLPLMSVDFDWVRIHSSGVFLKNGKSVLSVAGNEEIPDAEALYQLWQGAWPRFYKMDRLSKYAWLAASLLLKEEPGKDSFYDSEHTAMLLMSKSGCLEADKKYLESLADIPSPAMFVYTLPNIMMGELCISFGCKGVQCTTLETSFCEEELFFQIKEALTYGGMKTCLAGWVEVASDTYDICLFRITDKQMESLSPGSLRAIYDLVPLRIIQQNCSSTNSKQI